MAVGNSQTKKKLDVATGKENENEKQQFTCATDLSVASLPPL